MTDFRAVYDLLIETHGTLPLATARHLADLVDPQADDISVYDLCDKFEKANDWYDYQKGSFQSNAPYSANERITVEEHSDAEIVWARIGCGLLNHEELFQPLDTPEEEVGFEMLSAVFFEQRIETLGADSANAATEFTSNANDTTDDYRALPESKLDQLIRQRQLKNNS